jgi:hypothetical protein
MKFCPNDDLLTLGTEQVSRHEDVPRGAVLHEARQLRRGQCHEPSCHPTAAAPVTGTAVLE